jgi:hypothetical protein
MLLLAATTPLADVKKKTEGLLIFPRRSARRRSRKA